MMNGPHIRAAGTHRTGCSMALFGVGFGHIASLRLHSTSSNKSVDEARRNFCTKNRSSRPSARPSYRRALRMPWKPLKHDSSHKTDRAKGARKRRQHPDAAPYHSHLWKRVRRITLASTPRCESCERCPAAEIHHRNGNNRDNRPSNLQSLCKACHSNMALERFIRRRT